MDRRSVATRRRSTHPVPPTGDASATTAAPTPDEVADIVFRGRRGEQRRGTGTPTPTIDSVVAASKLEAVARGQQGPRSVADLAVLAAAALLWSGGVVYRSPDRGGYALELWVTLPDVALVVVLALLGASLLRRFRRLEVEPLVGAGLSLVLALLLSFVVHPFDRGAGIVARLLACIAITDHLGRSQLVRRGRLLRVLTVGLGVELVVALAQRLTGHAIGLYPLGERADPFFPFTDTVLLPSGLLGHPYPIGGAALAVGGLGMARAITARRIDPWAVLSTLLTGYAVVSTGSRTNVVGLALLALTAAVVALRRKVPGIGAALVVMLLLGAAPGWAITRDVWATKAAEAVVRSDVSTGRLTFLRENVDAFHRHPWLGVGPGRYNTSLVEDGAHHASAFPHPPQMVIMSAVTEAGIPGLLAVSGIVLSLVLLVRRHRAPLVLPLAAVAAPLFLDHYMWSAPEGMIPVAIAFGSAIALSHESNVTEIRPPRRGLGWLQPRRSRSD